MADRRCLVCKRYKAEDSDCCDYDSAEKRLEKQLSNRKKIKGWDDAGRISNTDLYRKSKETKK